MTRRQVTGFVVVLALIAAGLALRSRSDDSPDPLPALRRAAALAPCPSGLGSELPDLSLACLGGGSDVRLRSAAPGGPTVVNIWATWCGPCVREVPALVAFAKVAGERVRVVGVDTTDEDDKALIFARQYGMRYPSLIDPDGKVLRAFGGGPPITLLLDAEGRVRFRHRGELRSTEEIVRLVRQHLGVTL